MLGTGVTTRAFREETPIIGEIWSWDIANHGDSVLLNQEELNSLCNPSSSHHSPRYRRAERAFLDDWSDNVWKITNFLLNYLPDFVVPSTLPSYL